jgi:uracil-DNA glycosylase
VGSAGPGQLVELPAVVTPIAVVDQLLVDLAAYGPKTTCNFYAGRNRAAVIRRERLRRYLHARWLAPFVLVGEAAGYRGACRSGIPLTSERQLTGAGFAEASATIVHRVLVALDVERAVVRWNAVPYHPHAPGLHDSNRPPTPEEVAACQRFLTPVCVGRQVIAVGRIAMAALSHALDREVPYVRHPAHGGATAFGDGLAALLAAGPRRLA